MALPFAFGPTGFAAFFSEPSGNSWEFLATTGPSTAPGTYSFASSGLIYQREPEIADIGVGVSVVDLGTVPDPVPGPSTWVLVSTGLGGLMLSRRRHPSRAHGFPGLSAPRRRLKASTDPDLERLDSDRRRMVTWSSPAGAAS